MHGKTALDNIALFKLDELPVVWLVVVVLFNDPPSMNDMHLEASFECRNDELT